MFNLFSVRIVCPFPSLAASFFRKMDIHVAEQAIDSLLVHISGRSHGDARLRAAVMLQKGMR